MKNKFSNHNSLRLAALIFLAGHGADSFANPTGLTVSSGSATAQQLGSQLNITVSQLAILNWSSFNIAAGETTSFLQPSANSIVFNAIGGANPSQIFGSLNANGTVILANANGFYFGPNSMIKVGGSFIATTAPLAPDFGSGAAWQFTGLPPLAGIVNYGRIEVGQGRSLFLIAENIENHGSLNAPGGNLELAAGQNVLVSDRPDGRGLSATVKVPRGSVNNYGQITADAGTITLQAQVVNQNGIVQADSIQNQNGVIELVASDSLNLGADSQILARGDNLTPNSPGGTVALQSGNSFSDSAGSQISVAGGLQGGNGGSVEISAGNLGDIHSQLNGSAQAGFIGGKILIDPADLTLNSSSLDPYSGFANILFQATGSITLSQNTVWNLSGSTGVGSGQLTLAAGGDITFGSNSKITDANNWSVTLDAGYNSANGTINPGVGNIYLNSGSGLSQNGAIQLSSGSVSLFAGQSILVGSGSVSTTGGGSIFANALAGDINAGTANGSDNGNIQTTDYNFTDSGAAPNPFLGGISTAAGGNVTLIAGNNIDSTPIIPSRQAPGASGTYGAGDVTVIAGNQITGNYTLASGTGTMLAGVPVSGAQAAVLQNPAANPSAYATTLNDLVTAVQQSQNANGNIGAAPVAGAASTAPVTLSVINGAWNAWAANDISIKEVNNPNGAFNVSDSFLFDYAPGAAASFWAGNAIELVGSNLGRLTSQNRTPVYAPILSLNAGSGGIKIDKTIILAPSSEGALSVVTRDGGDLNGAVVSGSTVLNGIIMSDSASSDFTTFASEHDNIHLNDPNPHPVTLDISGGIHSFSLAVPTFANITVHGDTYNFGFKGRNLSAAQTTSINVLGNIIYRGDLTAIDLTAGQQADPLPKALFTDSADTSVTSKLRYDATTGQLIFVGVMSATDLAFLLNPGVLVLDKNGSPVLQPLLDANGNPVLDANGKPEMVPVTKPLALDSTQQGMITQLYAASQSASLGDQGLALAGPGNFDVTANSMELGVSGGIRVIAPDTSLAAISPYGANLNVTTLGDLSMTSTKIANESYLGGINLNVGGTLDVGGQFTTLGDASAPKGIFTTSGGNVFVTVNNDVNVNGSRIAAYNGGNIDVKSVNGDVNAGEGGAGYVSMNPLQLEASGQLFSIAATIPGSGILATTVVGSDAALGNITINAPNGSVNASLGGVLQIAFNGNTPPNTLVEVNAGHDINASSSGIIGSNIKLQAGGSINGLVIGSSSVNINSAQNVNVTAFSGGDVNISAGGQVTGTVISGGNVDVSGGTITASLIASSVSTSGNASGAAEGIPQSNVAQENAQVADNANTATSKTDASDDELNKKKKGIALAQKVSRVTVILPPKKVSETQTSNPGT